MKHFYSHLIEIDTLIVELDELDFSDKEKQHLSKMADSTMHNHILNAILSELSENDKAAFVQVMKSGDHDKIWNFLNERIDQVEDKVQKTAKDLKVELHKDVADAKRLKEQSK